MPASICYRKVIIMSSEKTRRELTYREYIQRENEMPRASYDPEMSFYNLVRGGSVDQVAQLCAEPLSEKAGLGTLSDDPVKNVRYHFIITAAMLARVCIDGGMELSLAYNLSDYYIKKADSADSAGEINELHRSMCVDFAERMRSVNSGGSYSRYVKQCIEYIYSNLHTRITLSKLAEVCGISGPHLSRLFREETGINVSEYIARKKLETAENMLAYSDYPISLISETLAFSDQSYFSERFRRRTGLTPLRYRNSRRMFGSADDTGHNDNNGDQERR